MLEVSIVGLGPSDLGLGCHHGVTGVAAAGPEWVVSKRVALGGKSIDCLSLEAPKEPVREFDISEMKNFPGAEYGIILIISSSESHSGVMGKGKTHLFLSSLSSCPWGRGLLKLHPSFLQTAQTK